MERWISVQRRSSGVELGFEEKLSKAADNLRSKMEATEYKHVILEFIFLKHVYEALKEDPTSDLTDTPQGGCSGDISVYGQESNQTTWRLCLMNLSIRGIDARIKVYKSKSTIKFTTITPRRMT